MTLTKFPIDPYLDLPLYRGQRVERFRYQLINGVTNAPIKWIHPETGTTPSLTHNTDQSIKRRLTINLGAVDTALVNPITDRVLVYMLVGGTTYPLGRYMFTDDTTGLSTGGKRGAYTLLDEGFIIDQPFEKAFSPPISQALQALPTVTFAIRTMLEQVAVTLLGIDIAPSSYVASGAFSAGQTRGQALDTYATQGDYFPYWMNNDGIFKMIRVIDPGSAIPDFDFDAGNKVKRDSGSSTRDVLTAPNRFIVISNAAEAKTTPITGVYDIPPSAPHSIQNRGFVISHTETLQITTVNQAGAAARNIGIVSTVYERVTLDTALDPRHDSYNVIRYGGDNWLELSWSMELKAGGTMNHVMRKAYV